MPRGKLTEKDKSEIQNLLQKGVTKGKIAAQFNVSEQTVYVIKREMKNTGATLPEPTGYGHVKGKSETNGNVVYLRGKAFSLEEYIEAYPEEKLVKVLTDKHYNQILLKFLKRVIRASELEKLEKEVPFKDARIRILEEKVRELEGQSVRKQLEISGVTHGD